MTWFGVRCDGQVASTFVNLADVPLSAFELRLRGGARGLLTVDARRCRLLRAQPTFARVAVRAKGGVIRWLDEDGRICQIEGSTQPPESVSARTARFSLVRSR